MQEQLSLEEQVHLFMEFIQYYYKDKLFELVNQGENVLVVDFQNLISFNTELAAALLDDPENYIKAFEKAISELDLELFSKTEFRVRFKNLPSSNIVAIRNIRSKHIGKLIQFSGIVRQKSDVRPQAVSAKFECPSCGNVIRVLQLETKFREPHRCSCGRKRGFKLLSKDLIDVQRIIVEESPEDLEGGEQPKRINVLLREDLVSPLTEKKTNPGSKVEVIGVLKEVPITLQSGGSSTRFDLIVEANNIVPKEQSFSDLKITPEEEEQILKLAKDPKIFEKLVESIAPSIYGYRKIKEALVLQLFGGVKKKRKDGVVTRGDIHILLVGDPGAGKSQLLRRIASIAPKGRFVSGKGVSGAGLTASVVKDDFLRGWALEAGALVLANGGICAIDELDKMSKEDRVAMHEALEQQMITISKANIQATLRAETTVLAAANPKFGRFDPYEVLAKQIDLPSTLINRFDLIFAIRDIPDKNKDEQLTEFVLRMHQQYDKEFEGLIDEKLLMKYIAYARQNARPKLTDAAIDEIKKYYLKMRSMALDENEAVRVIPISARQLEALVRLAEASAKIRLGRKVTKKDAQRAIELVDYSLRQIGLDPDTGRIDIDRITTGITASQRSKISLVREVIHELENVIGKEIPEEEIKKACEAKGLSEEDVEDVLEKLKRAGDIFSPKPGYIQRI